MQKLPAHKIEPLLCCIDMGTTRTRAWITEGGIVHARAAIDAGARDIAAGKTREWLAGEVGDLLQSVIAAAAKGGLSHRPDAAIAAGMITSGQGLVEVPHVEAPAGVADIARHVHTMDFPFTGNGSIPLLLVPGVRSGFGTEGLAATFDADLMRGEETLCLGLLDQKRLDEETLLLHLGSHWKLVWTDAHKRIAGSHTRLSGEMIHALQAHTLLASSVPQHPPHSLHQEWVQLGYDEAARSGLGRALFSTRLLDLRKFGTPEQRLSFLYGAVLQGEIVHLAAMRKDQNVRLLIEGPAALAGVCAHFAGRLGIVTDVLSEADRERAFLAGLGALYRAVQPA